MHRELAGSLSEIGLAASGKLAFDQLALDRLIDDLRHGQRYVPGVFGRYYDLVGAIMRDDPGTAEQLLRELGSARPVQPGLAVEALRPSQDDVDSARYLRLLREEGEAGMSICPPAPAVAQAFATRLDQGFALLDAAVPALAGEIRGLIRQVVTIASLPDTALHVDGGSHYQLWGALFLNAGFHPDAVAVAEVLAHESAHALLFGLCVDEALVENDPRERYASPLRLDPRPMDGIFHATFVSARMHWTMSRLADAAALSAAERDRAAVAARDDVVHFQAGHAVVRRAARLTPLGCEVMEAAADYMRAAS